MFYTIEFTEKRSNIYGLLAVIFQKEPTIEIVRELKKPKFIQTLIDLGFSVNNKFITGSAEQTVQDVSLEYTRLFIGPGKHIPPYESVHRKAEGLLWGKSTATVKKMIEFAGLSYRNGFSNIPDHISIELEFMQQLINREKEAREHNDEKILSNCLEFENKFVDEHLNQWVPIFCDKVVEMSNDSFYGQMARLTKKFVEFEKTYLKSAESG